jgi:hypothetical protein
MKHPGSYCKEENMKTAIRKSINLSLLLLVTLWASAAQSFCFSFGTGQRNSGFPGWRDPAAGYQLSPRGWPYSPVMPGMSGVVLQPVMPQQWNELRSRQLPVMRY